MNNNNAPEVLIVRLDPGSLDDLAHRVADLVQQQRDALPPSPSPVQDDGRLLTAAQVAAQWGVDRSWVYDHADELGVRRLGTGVRPRLRFDPVAVAAYLNGGDTTAPPAVDPRRRAADGRRSSRSASDCAELLPIRGRPELSSVTQRSRRPGGAATPPATAPKRRAPTR
jgi:hypothetical protein